ncbi:MAG: hypothetical protein ACI88H_001066 [Cocleimonas sp.]|jgi:hypothetical protein
MKFKLWPTSKVMQFSLIAFIISIVVSLLSIGFLGIGLFYVASPVLTLFFPSISNNLNTWHGDWIWPAMIGIPIVWSFGFLIAGRMYLHLESLDWTHLTVKTSYIVILLFLNILLWLILLMSITPEMA